MKNRIKNSLLIGSKAFAEPFLQIHHSPSLPLLLGANSIIFYTVSHPYEHPLAFPSASFSLPFMSILLFLPPSLPARPSHPILHQLLCISAVAAPLHISFPRSSLSFCHLILQSFCCLSVSSD